jgi:hypothetical protein
VWIVGSACGQVKVVSNAMLILSCLNFPGRYYQDARTTGHEEDYELCWAQYLMLHQCNRNNFPTGWLCVSIPRALADADYIVSLLDLLASGETGDDALGMLHTIAACLPASSSLSRPLAMPLLSLTNLQAAPAALLAILGFTLLPPLYSLAKVLLHPTPATVKNIPGPGRGKFIWGHFQDILENEHSVLHEQWLAQYGKVISYAMFFGVSSDSTPSLQPTDTH